MIRRRAPSEEKRKLDRTFERKKKKKRTKLVGGCGAFGTGFQRRHSQLKAKTNSFKRQIKR